MGRPELGTKYTCVSCNERFYDLNHVPAICPKCSTEQPAEKPRALRPSRGTVDFRRTPRPAVPAVAEDEVEPVSVADTEDEDDVPEVDDEIDEDIEIIPADDATPL